MIHKLLFTLSIFTLLVFIPGEYIRGQVPQTISYQGILTQSNGTVVTDGNYSLAFNLYTVLTKGTTLWKETQTVAVVKGIFNVILGSSTPIALPFNKQYYLGITVGTGSELTPRIQLTSSAYSLHAAIADSLTGNVNLNAAAPIKLSSFSSNPIISGTNTSSGNGVYGSSVSGYGVWGISDSNVGVYGTSSFAEGVTGVNTTPNYSSNIGTLGGLFGVYGSSPANSGVYGYSETGDAVCAIGAFQATGTKSAIVKLNNGSPVQLYCEEAAEVYFTDYGEGTLVNGKVHIKLDPVFLQTVTIDSQHPIKVFVQLEGDCNGVYVTNKSAAGFDVAELKGGVSNASFSYRVVCKRKYYEDERMATEQQAGVLNKRMMQTAWPEVVAKEKVKQDKIKAMLVEIKH
jgi:hypothetical protein